jgi:hypothetical protein
MSLASILDAVMDSPLYALAVDLHFGYIIPAIVPRPALRPAPVIMGALRAEYIWRARAGNCCVELSLAEGGVLRGVSGQYYPTVPSLKSAN